MLLTKTSVPVIGWFAILLGMIMNVIFIGQSAIGIDNIGLCIILFTIVVNVLMIPLTYQQQKFSRLQVKMNPELQAVQKKYKAKQGDQAAMAKMNEETQAIYAKYGVSPMGSCLQLVIQMPILFALYRVIWNIPAYVDKVQAAFAPLAEALMKTAGAEKFMTEAAGSVRVAFPEMTKLTLTDALYKFQPSNWDELAKAFPDLSDIITSTQSKIDHMNYFLGLNIADSPMNIITTAVKSGAFLLVIGGVMIPLLAALTQWLNAKLMTAASGSGDAAANDQTAATMKTMNNVMPLMSAVFCLTLPVGMGIYWIAGAVVRSAIQMIVNKRIDAIDIEELARQNLEKINAKRAKQGLPPEKMKSNATMSTRNIDTDYAKSENAALKKNADLQKQAANAQSRSSNKKVKAGSIASKAMMVQDFDEKHNKKK